MATYGGLLERRTPWVLWAALNVAGICLIALPDSDNRLFSISRTHGPAPADMAGALLLLAGWAILDATTWKRRRALRRNIGSGGAWWMLVVSAAGIVLIAWSVVGDRGLWWLLGALVVGAVQIGVAIAAGRTSRSMAPLSQ